MRKMIPLESFLISLFSHLVGVKIDYCILRNYQSLPQENVGSDIDILVDKVFIPEITQYISSLPGIRITGLLQRHSVTTFFLEGIRSADGKDTLQLDFVTALSWKGISYLETADVISQTHLHEGRELIHAPATSHEAIISFFSSYLVGGWIKDRYQDFVKHTFIQHELNIRKIFQPLFGGSVSKRLIYGVQEDQRNLLLQILPKVKLSFALRKMLKQPFHTIASLVSHYRAEFLIRFTPKPLIDVCILGVDGAGKSTVLDSVLKRMGSRAKEFEVIHLKPRLRSVPGVAVMPCTNPHALPPRSDFLSIIKLIQWILLYRIKRFAHGHRNVTVRFWDRYYHDLFIDPRRYRVGLRTQILELLAKFVPKPDAFIVLDVSPKVAYSRKQEIDFSDLVVIREGYLQFASQTKHVRVVSTEQDIAHSANEVVEFVTAMMQKRLVHKLNFNQGE